MITYQAVLQQLIDAGRNPDDFNITIFESGYKIEPRKSLEPRLIAQEEDTTVMLAVAELAETILGGDV